MDIAVRPLQRDEVDDFTQIYWDAFNPIEANMILPMIYPLGFQPDLKERLRNRLLKSIDDKLCFCALDRTSKQIVGVSWWSHVQNPPQNETERRERYFEAKESRGAGIEVSGMNQELEDAFFKAAF